MLRSLIFFPLSNQLINAVVSIHYYVLPDVEGDFSVFDFHRADVRSTQILADVLVKVLLFEGQEGVVFLGQVLQLDI